MLKKYRDKRAVAYGRLKEIQSKKEDMSDEELAEGEKLTAEIQELDAKIKRLENFATSANSVTQSVNHSGHQVIPDNAENVTETASISTHDNLLDDPQRGFSSMGEFASVVARTSLPGVSATDERLQIMAAASGNNQSVGSEGGILVPPSFSNTIWDGLNEDPDNLLSMTDNYTVDGESVTFPANAETSRANGSRYGGVRGYWISEADQITSSKPKFRQVKLEPHELGVLVYVTEKLLRNSPTALDQYISRAANTEINFMVGDAIVNGEGGGKPRGLLAGAAGSPRVQVSKETGQAANTIVAKNIDKMWSRLHAKARANAVWLINQDVEPQLDSLEQAVGTGGIPLYRPSGSIANSPLASLKGRPVLPKEYCQTLGTEGDIILVDLSSYVVGLKGGVKEAVSMHLRFDYAEMAFRFIFEVDGQPWLASALTPFKGSNTLSTIVTLATRS